ncbi:MAG: polymerase [Daejeonella sp.]
MTNKYLRLTLLITLITSCSSNSFSQIKFIKKLISGSKDTTRSASFLPVPIFGYAQETGFEYGIGSLYSFYTDRADTTTRSSGINLLAYLTTKKQSNFQIKADIWTPQNKYHFVNEVRYKNFPLNFYGNGNKTLKANEEVIIQKTFKLSAEVERRSGNSSYTGANLSYEKHNFKDKEPGGLFETDPFIYGHNGGRVLFIGLSQILDSRNTNTYTTKGIYFKINYSYAPDLFAEADNFKGSLTKLDFRGFKSFNSKMVLGFNTIYQSIQGNKTPFYLLPQLGNDQMMRGYYTGRYRDQNLLATQTEFRYHLTPRFGFVGFLAGGTVYSNGNFKLGDIKPNYGGGFRYFFDLERNLSVRVDYGIGEKRPMEKRQQGLYFSLGESF